MARVRPPPHMIEGMRISILSEMCMRSLVPVLFVPGFSEQLARTAGARRPERRALIWYGVHVSSQHTPPRRAYIHTHTPLPSPHKRFHTCAHVLFSVLPACCPRPQKCHFVSYARRRRHWRACCANVYTGFVRRSTRQFRASTRVHISRVYIPSPSSQYPIHIHDDDALRTCVYACASHHHAPRTHARTHANTVPF